MQINLENNGFAIYNSIVGVVVMRFDCIIHGHKMPLIWEAINTPALPANDTGFEKALADMAGDNTYDMQ